MCTCEEIEKGTHINFVVGNHRSVVEIDFYTKLKKLDVQEGGQDNLFADHVTQVCDAHNLVIVSFLQQVQGGTRPTTEGSTPIEGERWAQCARVRR